MTQDTIGKYKIITSDPESGDGSKIRVHYNLYVDGKTKPMVGCSGVSAWMDDAFAADRQAMQLGRQTARDRIDIDRIMAM